MQILGKVLIAENLRDCLWALELLANSRECEKARKRKALPGVVTPDWPFPGCWASVSPFTFPRTRPSEVSQQHEAPGGVSRREFIAAGAAVSALAFSPYGRVLAAGGGNGAKSGEVKVWAMPGE
jgi:hypothetical protein